MMTVTRSHYTSSGVVLAATPLVTRTIFSRRLTTTSSTRESPLLHLRASDCQRMAGRAKTSKCQQRAETNNEWPINQPR